MVNVIRVNRDDSIENVECCSCFAVPSLAPKIHNSRGATHADPHVAVVEEVPLSAITERAEN